MNGKKIKKMPDVFLLIAEIKSEIHYYGNTEMIDAFNKVLSEWGFDPKDFESD